MKQETSTIYVHFKRSLD